MKKRILKYERSSKTEGEDEEDDEEEEEGEADQDEDEGGSMKSQKVKKDSIRKSSTRKKSSPEGTSGLSGLEYLEKLKKPGEHSGTSFREMYADEIIPSIHYIQSNDEKSKDSCSLKDSFILGEDQFSLGYKGLPEMSGEKTSEMSEEKTVDQVSVTSLEEDLNAVLGEDYFEDSDRKKEEEEEKEKVKEKKSEGELVKKKKRKEGIPLCCLCRCIVPEGLTACPCGTTTVVEVFRKESVEIIIQSEDDYSYDVDYFESKPPVHHGTVQKYPSESSFEIPDDVPVIKKIKRNLPPESFLPFSPAQVNYFKETTRPEKLTKEYIDSFKPEKPIPPECYEYLELAKAQLGESAEELGEGSGFYEKEFGKAREESDIFETESEMFENEGERYEKETEDSFCKIKEEIKTDFSDLKLFVPCGLEDWRLTVQKKYREWFFKGSNIHDETYYDAAIEEISDDEFEVDKELEVYFEI